MMPIFPFAYDIKCQVDVGAFRSVTSQVAWQDPEVDWEWHVGMTRPSGAFYWPRDGQGRWPTASCGLGPVSGHGTAAPWES